MRTKVIGTVALSAVILLMGGQAAGASGLTYGPYAGYAAVGGPGTAPPDSCALDPGNPTTTNWALESYNIQFHVNDVPTHDGTYHVTARYRSGNFTTLGGDSPGKCEAYPSHGSVVPEGVTGKLSGNQHLTITPEVPNGFNPDGACERGPDGICTIDGFVHGFFGDGATYAVFYYRFTYTASNPTGLIYAQWVAQFDRSLDTGDIASS